MPNIRLPFEKLKSYDPKNQVLTNTVTERVDTKQFSVLLNTYLLLLISARPFNSGKIEL